MMIGGRRILAIVPARGGSKGVPRKNIRLVGGKPLIGWAISSALVSLYVDRVVVSSDDEEICEVAAGYGKDIVLKRPAEFATDFSTSLDVVSHAVTALPGFDVAVLLQPTSPLRTGADIDGCLELMVQREARSCISVCESEKSPFWMYRLDDDLHLVSVLDGAQNVTRRQDLPRVFVANGAIYAFEIDWIRSSRRFIDAETLGYIMPVARSVDVDTELDLIIAEQLMLAGTQRHDPGLCAESASE